MRGYLHIPIISILLSILPLYGEEPLTIGDVRFEGNETFSDNQLRSIIRLERGEKYDQFLIAINKFQLKNFYKQMGFLNVMQRWEKIVEKNEVESIIYIEEGTRAVIDTVKFHHNTVFDDNTVRNISGLKQPLPLVQSDILLARFNLLRAYSRKGHIHAQVITDTVQISKNHYLLNFYIDEGNPVYISDIILKGNRTVRNKVIKRRIGIGKGDVCNPEKIAESQFAIYGTGLFESVRHEIEESEGDSVSIIFYLRERPARAITFSTGYIYSDRNPNRLSIRLGWRHNNLWGNAQRIGIRPHFETDFAGYETRGIKLTYGEPHLFGTLYEAGLNLYLNREIRGRASQTVTGSNINLGRHIGRYDQGYIRYQYESIISRKSNIKRSKSSSVFASFSHSRKNDIFYPTRGLVVLLNLQYAGGVLGGDVDYNKAIIENIVYNKVRPGVVATRVMMGLIWNAQKVPLKDRFTIGGMGSIRGFDEKAIGPMINNVRAGNTMIVLNTEYRIEVMNRFELVYFFDFAGLWKDIRTMSLQENFGISGGIGVGYRSPIGPIRLDYAHRLKGPGGGNFYFTIGYMF